MAIHWVGVDTEAPEIPVSGTGSVTTNFAISWVDTKVSHRSQILDAVEILENYITQSDKRSSDDGLSSAATRNWGYSIPVGGSIADVVYTVGSGIEDADSILNNAGTGDIGIEMVFLASTVDKYFAPMMDYLKAALQESPFPIA